MITESRYALIRDVDICRGLLNDLDECMADWRGRYVVLLDNCPAHTSQVSTQVLAHLRVPVFFSAPASYLAILIEGIFGQLKALQLDAIADPDE